MDNRRLTNGIWPEGVRERQRRRRHHVLVVHVRHDADNTPLPRRIVGIVADVDDEHVVPTPALTIYHPFRQMPFVNRLFVHTTGDPHALVAPVTRIIREMSAEQPVERAATLAEVRAEVLAPERLNAFVFSGFAAVAALIAVIGVAGVLAFSVSARTREFGVRLAIGSAPGRLLTNVLSDGVLIAAAGIVAGVVVGYGLVRVSTIYSLPSTSPGRCRCVLPPASSWRPPPRHR